MTCWFSTGDRWAVWSRGNVFKPINPAWVCTQKNRFFSFAKWHVKTWWNSVDLFGDDPFAGQMSRCTCSTDLLQLVLKGVVLEMPWRDRISLTLQPGMTSANQTLNITGNMVYHPWDFLEPKSHPLIIDTTRGWDHPPLVGINKRPNWPISTIFKKDISAYSQSLKTFLLSRITSRPPFFPKLR